ncbi:MAG: hypothetical protein A3G81_34125 [Betaproteobacteria bacterium RIFCSPLOWO2_12_FULL_65_14]|nr:MAG: hypothetical protein A3G81_34125 [Betaproteobacteria bacterium RIFCSPLOWO2_12_FULL_65_14]
MRQRIKCFFRAAVYAMLAVGGAAEADFPERAVKMVVPYPPGSFTDALPRLVAEKLRVEWGQPVLVENRPGANGRIAAELVAKSAADGYTLFIPVADQLAIAPSLYRNIRYSTRDFAPISLLWRQTLVLVVRRDLPETTVAEIIRTAKANPGKFRWASWGEGSVGHLALELLKSTTGTDIVHVPYKGSLAGTVAVASGEVDMMITGYATASQLIGSGRVRLLARASATRSREAPDIPTIAEAGYPGYEAVTWSGLLAPRGTPRPVIEFIQRAVTKALAASDIQEKFKIFYADIAGSTPEEFANIIRDDEVKWSKIIRSAKIQLD